MDQKGYKGNPDFVAAAEGRTPRPENYPGLHTASKPATERPVFGKTKDEGPVKGRKRS